jgi:hypothetical protein
LSIGQIELPPDNLKAAISNSYAYVINKDSLLCLIDISLPDSPVMISSLRIPAVPSDIVIHNNCAYIAARNAGLLILNVYDPADISLVGTCSVSGFSALSLDLYGNLAYLAGTGGLRIINITTPFYPYLFSSWEEAYVAKEVFLREESGKLFAYVNTPTELWTLDVTNAMDIDSLCSYSSPYPITNLSVSGKYAYLGTIERGLEIVSMQEPANPRSISSIKMGDYTKDIFPNSGFLFITDIFSPARIVNVFNPDRPFVSGRWMVPGSTEGVAVKDSFAYILCENSGLHVLNVADPTHPQIMSALYAPYNNNGIDIDGNFVFITALLTGMQAIDVTDPSHPQGIGGYQPEGYTYGVKINDGYAYLLNAATGIQIIDIRNPYNLTPRGSIETPGKAQEITIRDEYLYIADFSAGLTIVNAEDKDYPVLVKSIPTVGRCKDVFVSGNLLFLTSEDVGMEIYDLTDPETPLFLGSYSFPGDIQDLFCEGDLAYLTEENHIIEVVDISDPQSPVPAASYDLLDNPGNLVMKDRDIFLCDHRSFKILRFPLSSEIPPPYPKQKKSIGTPFSHF